MLTLISKFRFIANMARVPDPFTTNHWEKENNLLPRGLGKIHEKDRQFFQPLWRRLAAVVALSGWTAVEWWYGNSFWGTLTSGALVYCVWLFAVSYRKPDKKSQRN